MVMLVKDMLKTEVLHLLNEKIGYFRSFRNAANLRGQLESGGDRQQRQFKTEKWLQAELVHHFWAKDIQAVPEYSKAKWDLYIQWPDVVDGFRLALKCFADSAQNADFDYVGVAKDLSAIAALPSGQAFFALALPLVTESGDKQRYKYFIKMLQRIEKHPMRKHLDIQSFQIPFLAEANEGITLVWIEHKG